MYSLLSIILVVVILALALFIYGIVYFKRTGKLMGVGYVIIALFLGELSYKAFGEMQKIADELVSVFAGK